MIRHRAYEGSATAVRVALVAALLVAFAPAAHAEDVPRTVDPALLRQLKADAAALRGKALKRDVPLVTLGEDEWHKLYPDPAPAQRGAAQPASTSLASVGLVAENTDLVTASTEYAREAYGGYYQEFLERIVLRADAGDFAVEDQAGFIHEVEHATQDQYYGIAALKRLAGEDADRYLAIKAVIEGDATFLSYLWAAEHFPDGEPAARRWLYRQGSITATVGYYDDDYGDADAGETPRIFRTQSRFFYGNGRMLVEEAFNRAGGYGGVDALFANLPLSTEQVLHPDKYFAHERPEDVPLPRLAGSLGAGWRTVSTGVMGELGILMLLQEYGEPDAAAQGAAGWAGGRLQVLEKDGHTVVVLKTRWDTELDAREFYDTYAHVLRVRFAQASQEMATPVRQALAGPGNATDLRIAGREVLAVIGYDRAITDTVVQVVGGF